MAWIVSSKLWINDVPGEFVAGQQIPILYTRGTVPHKFTMSVREEKHADGSLRALKNPVTIKVECADATVTQKAEIEFKGWYILSRRQGEWGWVTYQFADARWFHAHQKFTGDFNILTNGDTYRRNSLHGRSPWTCIDAAVEVLEKLGYKASVDPKIDPSLRAAVLPDNLGNSEGGGFFAASLSEVIPVLLEHVGCDITHAQDGSIMVVDRVTERSEGLKKYINTGGGVSKADVHWQKPKMITVAFEKRVERKFDYTESSQSNERATSAGGRPGGVVPELENVTPDWSPEASGPVSDLREIGAWLASLPSPYSELAGPSDDRMARVREFFMAPSMYNTERSDDEVTARIKSIVEGFVRDNWRLTYRVRMDRQGIAQGSIEDVRSRFARPELGRLNRDGTGRRDGAVFMDYTIMLRRPQRLPGEHLLMSTFSQGVEYSLTKPAPFTAEWLDRGEMVFKLSPSKAMAHQAGYLPGRLTKDKGYIPQGGSLIDVINGRAKLVLDATCDFLSSFRLAVFWHALYVGDGPGDYSRTYEVSDTGFADGEVPELVLRGEGLTANFEYVQATGRFPGRLLNLYELQERAKQLREEIIAALDQGKAGISRHGGVDVLTKGNYWVGGDIHEVGVIIGARASFSIDTYITVLPGARKPAPKVFTQHRQSKRSRELQ